MTAVRDFRSSFFNPRHGTIGMVTWPSMVLFEYLAPIVEFAGWLAIPAAVLSGALSLFSVAAFFVLAVLAGAMTSLVALLLDARSEEHTSELQSRENIVCRLLLGKN